MLCPLLPPASVG